MPTDTGLTGIGAAKIGVGGVGAAPVAAPGWTARKGSALRIVDCDVHHSFETPEQLLPYLSRVHQEHLIDQGMHIGGDPYPNVPFRTTRPDLKDPGLKRRDFNFTLEFTQRELLDRWNIDIALLTGSPSDIYGACGVPDPDWGAALCRAFNDYTIERWLERDERVVNAILVAATDPAQAVVEIRRLGGRPDTAAVHVPLNTARPFGNRCHDPIWEACAEHDLPVIAHIGGGGPSGNTPTPVGYPTYYMETRLARQSVAMAQAASLIVEGVFEKFPTLKFGIIETQQMWAVSLMWQLDFDWKAIGDQTPWLKRLPSEYFREHIRVGTQPMHEPEVPEHLLPSLEMLHAGETLIFCSDFPHFDQNDPVTALPDISDHLRRRIFSDNALEMLRVPTP
ncbi:MAG: amidohydrolase family protein [Spirochaetaceae bacterium]|nr:amidohydrolase family protein [Spirochaetaceae bacterium]